MPRDSTGLARLTGPTKTGLKWRMEQETGISKLTLAGGWLQQARRVASPNFGPRPEGCAPRLLVIHNISLPPGRYGGDCIERLFTNCLDWDEHPFFDEIRGARVSAHLLIRRDGNELYIESTASPIRNDRGEEMARKVVGVGALGAGEERTVDLTVEMSRPLPLA